MENAQNFNYNYSAQKNKEVEKIRNKYVTQEESKIERLRRLDKRASTAGMTETLLTGIIGSLIFGTGMCFGLDALRGADWLTLAFTIPGVLIMLAAHPIYKLISKKVKAQVVPEILNLSEEISAEQSKTC